MKTQQFANNVHKILKHDGYSIGEFEKELGMSKGALSRIVTGNRQDMPFELACNMADKLGYSLEEVLLTDWVSIFEREDREKELEELREERKKIDARMKELENV